MAKSKAESARKDWVIRGIVAVVLTVLIVLTVKELGIRRQATASHAALSDLLAIESHDQGILKSQVTSLIQGAPQMEQVDVKTLDSKSTVSAERYTWQGVLRNYSMTVGYSLGKDPEVEFVEGPK